MSRATVVVSCLVLWVLAVGCATGVQDEPWVQNNNIDWNGDGGGGSAGASTTSSTSTSGIGGFDTGSGGATLEELPLCEGELVATVRDFRQEHPDFENYTGSEAFEGLVESTLTADDKPVYAHPGGTSQTTGPEEFAQWYEHVTGVNEPITVHLTLTETSPGTYAYDNDAFFPIDGRGFGDEGRPHNYHFTTEIHTAFLYRGGEQFSFSGDDDLWLFINGKLAIDLGGLHPELTQTVRLDDVADDLGIERGHTYSMDIFHAERHTPESNFHLETTISCFQPPK